MKNHTLVIAALLSCLLGSGCVTGRRTVGLPVGHVPGTGASKGSLYLGSIEDQRTFQNKPADASTPSVDGDVTKCSKEELATMIGRQRNGYGRALGDIALPPGESVLTRTRALMEEGLKRRGFTIANDPASMGTATVKIDEFWAWFTPGMWTVSFQANVVCQVTVAREGVAKKLVVKGYGRNQGQVASDANWQLAYTRAFDDFLANLEVALSGAGL
jgi:hypothetical protein